jgi:hypothetical protein
MRAGAAASAAVRLARGGFSELLWYQHTFHSAPLFHRVERFAPRLQRKDAAHLRERELARAHQRQHALPSAPSVAECALQAQFLAHQRV